MSCLTVPSTSAFELSRKDRILSRKTQLRLAAQKVRWAKKTIFQRNIRAQIDKEFESVLYQSQNTLERLELENETLKKTTAEILGRCAALLNPVSPPVRKTLDWSVPSHEDLDSAYSSESEFLSPPSFEYKLWSKTKF